jgi:hypothetical protein
MLLISVYPLKGTKAISERGFTQSRKAVKKTVGKPGWPLSALWRGLAFIPFPSSLLCGFA